MNRAGTQLPGHVRLLGLMDKRNRLWRALTQAIMLKDMEAATDAKSAVEDAQRESRKKMDECGGKHTPRFFEIKDGRWVPKIKWVFLPSSIIVIADLAMTF